MPTLSEALDTLAEALFLLASPGKRVEAVRKSLGLAADLCGRDEPLRRFLGDPAVSPEGKQQALRELLAPHVDPLLLNFLMILEQEGQIGNLRELAGRFDMRVAGMTGRVAGKIVSAQPLPAATVDAVTAEAARILGRDVVLTPHIEPDLLGGIRLHIGDFVIDGTVDAHLETMRRTLAAP